mgnify:FL=1
MFTIKLKSCIIVIKIFTIPSYKSMAPGAVGNTPLFKLLTMRIIMAVETFLILDLEFLCNRPILFLNEMALSAAG